LRLASFFGGFGAQASYTYTSMAAYCGRDNVALHGFRAFFEHQAEEVSFTSAVLRAILDSFASKVFREADQQSPCTLFSVQGKKRFKELNRCAWKKPSHCWA
jgi:hypothetical protein